MNMNIRTLLYSDTGKYIISIILGLGLALLFEQSCQDNKCIRFSAPNLSNLDGKIYKFNDKCYRYDLKSVSYDKNKKQINTH